MTDDKIFYFNWKEMGNAVITGASSGIGEEFAYQLSKIGFDTILIARRKEKLDSLASKLSEEFGNENKVIAADLTNEKDLVSLINQLNNYSIDILVNNAGFGTTGKFHQVNQVSFIKMLKLFIEVPSQLCRLVIPKMIEQHRGIIINVSSLSSWFRYSGAVTYAASKTFLTALSEGLAVELNSENIKIQALCPGYTYTEFHTKGDYENYDRSKLPSFLWMDVKDVVEESLNALNKKKIILIPGRTNRILKRILYAPIFGSYLRKKLSKKLGK